MKFDRLYEFLNEELPMMGVPGSDTIVYLNHEEVFRHTVGFNSMKAGTHLKKDAVYNLYSCTKISTCTAATQLIERGELLITDPLYMYIPEFRHMKVKVKDENGKVIGYKDAENPILIRHLLTMTSGMNYDLEMPSLLKAKEETNGACPTLDMVRAMAKEPLEFEPGTHYQYSLSLDVIGAVIEVVTGMSFAEYMQEHVFAPLGMKNTAFHATEEMKSRMAAMYDYDGKTHTPIEIPTCNKFVFGSEYESGGAGLLSTVEDQILLADALTHLGMAKNGNRILTEAGVNLMRANALSPEILPDFSPKLGAHFIGYGYGFGVRTNMHPELAGNLFPIGEFGWDGARMCYMICDPQDRLAVFHAESMGYLHHVIQPRLRNIIYSAVMG